ncbi:LysR family transcriptional regulator [Nocardia aurantiaca]|uniref:LysR family transcriptional regulator n=1 Tax=Nocardia aurantiaca TaxID=2675850 RepID=A0A6I3LCB9_9NOCA|nr:LysR family transcriptional regulator [Nocardia aurantiaca]
MVDLDVRHVESFLVVSEELNITRAARRLHLTQQAVSAQLQQLERSLGVTLLVRTSRGVLLTAAGEELAAGGAKVVADWSTLVVRVRRAAQTQTGAVRLACCPYATNLFAVDVAEAMEARFPGLDVELTSVSTPADELELLTSGQADAAFMWLPIGDIGLNHAVIRTDARAVAVPDRHPLAQRQTVTLAELANDPVLRPEVLTCAEAEDYWLVDPRPDGAAAPRGARSSSLEDCLLQVARGKGIWMAPEPISSLAPIAKLRWIPVTDGGTFELAVVWTDRAPEPLIGRMIAELRTITGYQLVHAA